MTSGYFTNNTSNLLYYLHFTNYLKDHFTYCSELFIVVNKINDSNRKSKRSVHQESQKYTVDVILIDLTNSFSFSLGVRLRTNRFILRDDQRTRRIWVIGTSSPKSTDIFPNHRSIVSRIIYGG